MKTKHFKSRHALLMSLTSLMLCVSMLFGATFAWFTDSVTSGVNRIVSGNLDVELRHNNANTANAESEEVVSDTTKLFKLDINGDALLWEPEVISFEKFTVNNLGTLALKYQMTLNNVGYNTVADESGTHHLAEVVRAAVVTEAPTRDSVKALYAANGMTVLKDFVNSALTLPGTVTGHLTAKDTANASEVFYVVLYWPQSTGDNTWNVQNGKTTNDGQPLYVDLGITLLATQDTVEADSFDNQYDFSAEQPEDKWAGVSTAFAVAQASGGKVSTTIGASASNDSDKNATSIVLSGVKIDGVAVEENTKIKVEAKTTNVLSSNGYKVSDAAQGATEGTTDAVAVISLTTTAGDETVTGAVTFDKEVVDTFVTKNMAVPYVWYDGETTGAFSTPVEFEAKTDAEMEAFKAADYEDVAVGKVYYCASNGRLIFATNHNSDYVVLAGPEAYNATTDTVYGKLYEDGTGAINLANPGDTIVLLTDVESENIAVTKNLTLDGNGKTLTNTLGANGRGVYVDENNVTLNLSNLKIDGDGLARAVQVHPDRTGVTLNINNCILNTTTYAINFCNRTSVDVTINNSTVTGWGALNIWSSGVRVEAKNSTFNGINDKSYNAAGWNNFATIVLEGDTTQASDMGASNMQVTLTNCTITASQTTGNNQALVGFNNNSGSGANNNGVILANCTLTYGDNCKLMYDKGTDNKLVAKNCTLNGEAFALDTSILSAISENVDATDVTINQDGVTATGVFKVVYGGQTYTFDLTNENANVSEWNNGTESGTDYVFTQEIEGMMLTFDFDISSAAYSPDGWTLYLST